MEDEHSRLLARCQERDDEIGSLRKAPEDSKFEAEIKKQCNSCKDHDYRKSRGKAMCHTPALREITVWQQSPEDKHLTVMNRGQWPERVNLDGDCKYFVARKDGAEKNEDGGYYKYDPTDANEIEWQPINAADEERQRGWFREDEWNQAK